jgi:hypothetical protein
LHGKEFRFDEQWAAIDAGIERKVFLCTGPDDGPNLLAWLRSVIALFCRDLFSQIWRFLISHTKTNVF